MICSKTSLPTYFDIFSSFGKKTRAKHTRDYKLAFHAWMIRYVILSQGGSKVFEDGHGWTWEKGNSRGVLGELEWVKGG